MNRVVLHGWVPKAVWVGRLAETNKKIVFHIMKCAMHVNECCYDVVSGYKRAELPTSTEDESYI